MIDLIRGLYDYHRWANRGLLDVATTLGEETAGRAVGTQFSFPTLRGMFAHVYGADYLWLQRCRGETGFTPPTENDFATLAALRQRWDPFEKDQQAFVAGLQPADLDRPVKFSSRFLGGDFECALGPLLLHVADHATHHRSEIATMLTRLSGSPPPTDLVVYELDRLGKRPA